MTVSTSGMVDCILIDPDYDGQVFNVVLSDVVMRKNDFGIGEYELPLLNTPATVAIKIIGMCAPSEFLFQLRYNSR